MGKYSTERLSLARPHAQVLAHSWRLMPHLCLKPVPALHLRAIKKSSLTSSCLCLQQNIRSRYLKLGQYTFTQPFFVLTLV